jgi:hypothetical protein
MKPGPINVTEPSKPIAAAKTNWNRSKKWTAITSYSNTTNSFQSKRSLRVWELLRSLRRSVISPTVMSPTNTLWAVMTLRGSMLLIWAWWVVRRGANSCIKSVYHFQRVWLLNFSTINVLHSRSLMLTNLLHQLLNNINRLYRSLQRRTLISVYDLSGL